MGEHYYIPTEPFYTYPKAVSRYESSNMCIKKKLKRKYHLQIQNWIKSWRSFNWLHSGCLFKTQAWRRWARPAHGAPQEAIGTRSLGTTLWQHVPHKCKAKPAFRGNWKSLSFCNAIRMTQGCSSSKSVEEKWYFTPLMTSKQVFVMETWQWSTYTNNCNTAVCPPSHNLTSSKAIFFWTKDNHIYSSRNRAKFSLVP